MGSYKPLNSRMTMETILTLLIGIGLSAACGFRVFVPLLVLSIASNAGHLNLATGFEWIGSTPALIAFALATVLEIAAYYVPWVDNLMDTIAGPAAVVAGTMLTASLMTDVSPFVKWTLAVIAGGGVAGVVKGSTAVTRGASTLTTGGLGNPVIATIELGSSIVTSLLAIVIPVVAILVVALLIFLFSKVLFRRPARSQIPDPA